MRFEIIFSSLFSLLGEVVQHRTLKSIIEGSEGEGILKALCSYEGAMITFKEEKPS